MEATRTTDAPPRHDTLPGWRSVLAVVAHPDDESFALGAVIDTFVAGGARVSVLCLTHGEASTVNGAPGDLGTLRAAELGKAADALGATRSTLRDHPDGRLAQVPVRTLADEVRAALEQSDAEGVLVFDPGGVTGHDDHRAATAAALLAAEATDRAVLGWTLPLEVARQLNEEFPTAFGGHPDAAIDIRLPVDRTRQRVASLAHASQAVPTSVLWRRLELLGEHEHLRWLRGGPSRAASPGATMRVGYRTGDSFEISVRGHTLLVDQPVDLGGDDLAPTPTELFVASLASCVAFYARRYLKRHRLPAEGLAVEVSYGMGSKPARVAEVDLRITVPEGVPEERRAALLGFASHCTVHNSVTRAPEITISLR